ncbi:MAG: hypothetical protein Q7T41_00725 [Candidatus Saccharibacteria bacterium]|nr:hypothetical protein [Candidatus Saccharibacteria bacterium]
MRRGIQRATAVAVLSASLFSSCSKNETQTREEASNSAFLRAERDFREAGFADRFKLQFLDNKAYKEEVEGENGAEYYSWWKKGSDCLSGTIYDPKTGAEVVKEEDVLVVRPSDSASVVLYFTGIGHEDTILVPVSNMGVEDVLAENDCPSAEEIREVADYDHHLEIVE